MNECMHAVRNLTRICTCNSVCALFIYVCVNVFVYCWLNVNVYVSEDFNACMYVCMYVFLSVYLCIFVCMFVHVCTCV